MATPLQYGPFSIAWKIPWTRSLVGYSPWGHKELDRTERLHFTLVSQEDYSNYFWEGAKISRIWATAHSLVFGQCLGTVMAPLGLSFHLLIDDQGLVLSTILLPFDSNQFMLCPWAMSFFQKLCPVPFPPVTMPHAVDQPSLGARSNY